MSSECHYHDHSKKVSILEQARDALRAKQTDQDFNNLLSKEYDKMNRQNKQGIAFLKGDISRNPDSFDNSFRNLRSYVAPKLKGEVIKRRKDLEVKEDLYELQ